MQTQARSLGFGARENDVCSGCWTLWLFARRPLIPATPQHTAQASPPARLKGRRTQTVTQRPPSQMSCILPEKRPPLINASPSTPVRYVRSRS